ncbi:MAG: DUF58 domain-containing protein [Planctomycetaceae bacterium]|nr:DUF58 domain-containing protein [Planctomycetaceae bacterium]
MALSRSKSKKLELLDPQTLARIGGLELVSRTVVDGVMSGMHRSTHKGGCCDFDEHRPYSQGDDLRLIDWRLLARSDRYFIKQFEDETNLHAWLLLDTSGSMRYGGSTMSKFDYARMTAACLARLLLKQRDSIGLMTSSGSQRQVVPPRPQASHFMSIINRLQTLEADGATALHESVTDLLSVLKRRSLVVVFSDCFGDLEQFAHALQQVRLRGHDVLVFQVLAPEEISFSFRNPSIFEDLEARSVRLSVHPGAIRRHYLEQFESFMQRLHEKMVEIDCEFLTLSTERHLGDSLAYYLRRRAARRRLQGGRA